MDVIASNSKDNPHYLELSSIDLHAFMKAVDQCKGPVIMFTDEGDKFNLKSTLSKAMGFLSLVEGGRFAGAKVYCPEEEDVTLLFRLGLFGAS